MTEEKKTKRPRRSFTDEFKAEAVKLVLEGDKAVAQVAKELDCIRFGEVGRASER